MTGLMSVKAPSDFTFVNSPSGPAGAALVKDKENDSANSQADSLKKESCKKQATSMPPKKRKADDTAVNNKNSNSNSSSDGAIKKLKSTSTTSTSSNDKTGEKNSSSSSFPGGYQALTLKEIKERVVALMERVPAVDPDQLTPHNPELIDEWAATLQAVIEEFNLLVCLISSATYKWGTDRSGAADQNLSLLSGELQASQEQISSTVTPRLTNILAPVVDLVIEKSIISHSPHVAPLETDTATAAATTSTSTVGGPTTATTIKTKHNVFTQKQVDPHFLNLCRKILSRNASLLRQVCLSNFYKVSRCIGDFLQAQEKEHDSRGFAY